MTTKRFEELLSRPVRTLTVGRIISVFMEGRGRWERAEIKNVLSDGYHAVTLDTDCALRVDVLFSGHGKHWHAEPTDAEIADAEQYGEDVHTIRQMCVDWHGGQWTACYRLLSGSDDLGDVAAALWELRRARAFEDGGRCRQTVIEARDRLQARIERHDERLRAMEDAPAAKLSDAEMDARDDAAAERRRDAEYAATVYGDAQGPAPRSSRRGRKA